MRFLEILSQLWAVCRGLLLVSLGLSLANLALYAALDLQIVPRIADQERVFLQRQAEVRQLLHNQGEVAGTPEQQFVLARQDLSRFRGEIPEYREFTGLIEELMVLAARAQLDITQISYQPEQMPKSDLLRYDLSFNVTGEYEQVKKFIHTLEQSERLLAIRQIGLQGAPVEGVSLRVRLETYFRPGGEAS